MSKQRWGTFLGVVVLLGWCCAAHPMPVADIYTVAVPVTSQAANERNRAMGRAMEILLVRLSGTRRVTYDPAARAAISDAATYVTTFSYRRREAALPPGDGQAQAQPPEQAAPGAALPVPDFSGLLGESAPAGAAQPAAPEFELILQFRAQAVLDLLRHAGLPVWSRDRPAILPWLVIADGGQRQLVLPVDGSGAWARLEELMVERGLPLVTPEVTLAFGVDDGSGVPATGTFSPLAGADGDGGRPAGAVYRSDLTAEQAWLGDTAAIQAAARRYRADRVLLVRLLREGGQWQQAWDLAGAAPDLPPGSPEIPASALNAVADAPVYPPAEAVDRAFGGDTCAGVEACLAQVIDEVAESMSGRYSVVSASAPGGRVRVRVRVDGLADFTAYTDVLLYWQNLELVKDVQVVSASGRAVVFDLQLEGSAQQLRQQVLLNRRLLEASIDAGTAAGELRYQWLGDARP